MVHFSIFGDSAPRLDHSVNICFLGRLDYMSGDMIEISGDMTQVPCDMLSCEMTFGRLDDLPR